MKSIQNHINNSSYSLRNLEYTALQMQSKPSGRLPQFSLLHLRLSLHFLFLFLMNVFLFST